MLVSIFSWLLTRSHRKNLSFRNAPEGLRVVELAWSNWAPHIEAKAKGARENLNNAPFVGVWLRHLPGCHKGDLLNEEAGQKE